MGQEIIARTLQNEIRTGRIAHAYLFSGPRGVGKTTTARLLAKTVNCTGRGANTEPDNTCDSCRALGENRALDIIELDAATHTGIDMVREHIIENAAVRPMQLTYKVFIIDEVHRLSPNSFDALLKTLEEPPAHVIFILATTELHKVPETIVSRCQRFTFHHIAPDVMRARLEDIAKQEKKTVENAVLETIIARSGGCMRDAESILDQLFSLGDSIGPDEANLVLPQSQGAHAYPFVRMVLAGDTQGALETINQLVTQGVSLEPFNRTVIEILRALLVSHFAPAMTFPYLEGFEQERAALTEAAATHTMEVLQEMLTAFLESLPALKNTSVPALPLELAIVRIAAVLKKPEQMPALAYSAPRAPEKNPPSAPPDAGTGSEPTSTETQNYPPLSREQATEIMNQLTAEMQKTNPSVALILRNTSAMGSVNDALVLEVAFPLYHDQLMGNGNRRLIETQLCAITGTPWKLTCRLVDKETAKETSAAEIGSLAGEIAAAFGGEVS